MRDLTDGRLEKLLEPRSEAYLGQSQENLGGFIFWSAPENFEFSWLIIVSLITNGGYNWSAPNNPHGE